MSVPASHTQFKEERQPLFCGVGLDDQFHNLSTLFPQFTPQGVFIVSAEIPDDLLKIDRESMAFL
jgi:hypothetical protein